MIRFRVTILLIVTFIFSACSTSDKLMQPAPPVTEWQSVANPTWYDASMHDTISVVTWNIEHFVDDYDSPYIDNDRENEAS